MASKATDPRKVRLTARPRNLRRGMPKRNSGMVIHH